MREFDSDRSRREHVKDRHFFLLSQGEESPFRLDVQDQWRRKVVADKELVVVSHDNLLSRVVWRFLGVGQLAQPRWGYSV